MALMADVSLVSKLGALTAAVWATPPRYWRQLAGLGIAREDGRSDPCRAIFGAALGSLDDNHLSGLCAARRRALREAKIQVMGLAGPWRSWRPAMHLKGHGHLFTALSQGKGAILWVSPFVYSHLVFKMAMRHAGYAVTQLSRPTHGFGRSPAAVRLLNPIWMQVEERFLKERVMICGPDAGQAVSRLRSRLAENGIVVITVGNEARHTVEVPFLNYRLRLATGPAYIAQSSGAALLPAFAVRNEEGAYDVWVEAPLQVPVGGEGRERLAEVAAALAQRIEPYVRRYPEQWGGWNELIAEGELASDNRKNLNCARPDPLPRVSPPA